MADQASVRMSGNGLGAQAAGAGPRPERPGVGSPSGVGSRSENGVGPGDVVTNVAEFGEHLLTLAELQARLAAIELKQNVEAVRFGAILLVSGAVIGAAALPVGLAGLAELLATATGMNRGLALLISAGAAFVVAGVCAAVGLNRLTSSDAGFHLSREELARNVNWVRTVLLHSGRSARLRRR